MHDALLANPGLRKLHSKFCFWVARPVGPGLNTWCGVASRCFAAGCKKSPTVQMMERTGGASPGAFFWQPQKKKQKKRLSCSSIWSGWQGFFLKLNVSIQNMYCIGILAFAYIFQTAFVKVLNNSCEFCSIHPAPYCHKGWGPIELELFSSYNVAGFQPDLDSGWFPEALHSHESQAGVRVWISW